MQMLRNELFRPWFVNEKDWGIEIVDGEFSGVSIQIESLEFEESSDGNVKLDYHTVHRPENISEEDLKSDMFKAVIELILNDVIREAIEIYEQQTRNNNSTEPSSQ
jgi:hypothetical protein